MTQLEVKNLKKYFMTPAGSLHAVDDVSFTVEKGKTLGVVGESGCGKSTLGRAILALNEATGGQVLFEGVDITHPKGAVRKKMKRDMQIIFQDPYSSLDSRMNVQQLIAEPLNITGIVKGRENVRKRVLELMDTASPPGTACPIPTSWTAVAASASASRGPSPWSRNSSYATNLCPRWTCPSRPRS